MTYAQIFDDGTFDILYKKNSYIINNHRRGGQSSQRFERIREEQIKAWFKEFGVVLDRINQKVVLGTHNFYKNQIFKVLSEQNKNKISQVFSTEYADESGVYQYMNKNVYK